jgi:hypothetical protein
LLLVNVVTSRLCQISTIVNTSVTCYPP